MLLVFQHVHFDTKSAVKGIIYQLLVWEFIKSLRRILENEKVDEKENKATKHREAQQNLEVEE